MVFRRSEARGALVSNRARTPDKGDYQAHRFGFLSRNRKGAVPEYSEAIEGDCPGAIRTATFDVFGNEEV